METGIDQIISIGRHQRINWAVAGLIGVAILLARSALRFSRDFKRMVLGHRGEQGPDLRLDRLKGERAGDPERWVSRRSRRRSRRRW
jgi:hypothetical protein